MFRVLTFFVAMGLGAAALGGVASAQTDVINSDGGYVTADDDLGNTNIDGGGENVVYGDVSTGGAGGEVLGDPTAIYYPDLSGIPVPGGGSWTPTIVGIPVGNPNSGDMLNGIDVVFAPPPAPAPEAVAEDGMATEGEVIAEDGVATEEAVG